MKLLFRITSLKSLRPFKIFEETTEESFEGCQNICSEAFVQQNGIFKDRKTFGKNKQRPPLDSDKKRFARTHEIFQFIRNNNYKKIVTS